MFTGFLPGRFPFRDRSGTGLPDYTTHAHWRKHTRADVEKRQNDAFLHQSRRTSTLAALFPSCSRVLPALRPCPVVMLVNENSQGNAPGEKGAQ